MHDTIPAAAPRSGRLLPFARLSLLALALGLAACKGGAEGAPGKDGKNGKEEEVDIIAGEDEAEDTYPLLDGGAWADLEALLRDTLVEELPLQPLCKPDCKGLCSQCGIDLNENPDHQHDMTDIRFAALEGLKAKLEGKE